MVAQPKRYMKARSSLTKASTAAISMPRVAIATALRGEP